LGYFFCATASKLYFGPTHSPNQWISGSLSHG